MVELGVEGLQAFELVFNGQALFGFFFISLLNQLAEAVDAFVERIEQLLEMVVVLLGKAAAFLFQNSVGEVLELVAQVLTRICQQGQFFFGGLTVFFRLGVEALVLDLKRVVLLQEGGVFLFQTAFFGFLLL